MGASACHAKLRENPTRVFPIEAWTLATHTAICDPLSGPRLAGFLAKSDPLVRRVIAAIGHRATRRLPTTFAIPALNGVPRHP